MGPTIEVDIWQYASAQFNDIYRYIYSFDNWPNPLDNLRVTVLTLDSRHDPLHMKKIMQNFSSIYDVEYLEILQRCMEYCSATGLLFWP